MNGHHFCKYSSETLNTDTTELRLRATVYSFKGLVSYQNITLMDPGLNAR